MLRRSVRQFAGRNLRMFSTSTRRALPSGARAEEMINAELFDRNLVRPDSAIVIKPFKSTPCFSNASFAVEVDGQDKLVASLMAKTHNNNNAVFSRILSDAGLFPKIHFCTLQTLEDPNVGLMIREFKPSFDVVEHIHTGSLTAIGAAINKMAQIKLHPDMLADESEIFQTYYYIAKHKTAPVIQEMVAEYDTVSHKLNPSHDNACVLHGDLDVGNTVLPEKNTCLFIDCETARKASAIAPFVDMARFAFDLDKQQEKELFEATFGEITAEKRAVYLQAKQIAYLRQGIILVGLRENLFSAVATNSDALKKCNEYTNEITHCYQQAVAAKNQQDTLENNFENARRQINR